MNSSSQEKFKRSFKREMSIETLKAKAFFVFKKKVQEYLSDSEIEDSILEEKECQNNAGEKDTQNGVEVSVGDENQKEKKMALSTADQFYGLCSSSSKKKTREPSSSFMIMNDDHRKFSQGSGGDSPYDSHSTSHEGLDDADFKFSTERDLLFENGFSDQIYTEEMEALRKSIISLESEGLFKEEETFRGPGEFVRENVGFLTTRHWSKSKSTLNLSDLDLEEFDEREFQLELENYFEELSNLDENDWSFENEDQQEILGAEQQWPKLYEDIIRNADFAIGDAISMNLQMRTQWFKDLNQALPKLAVKASTSNPELLDKKGSQEEEGIEATEETPISISCQKPYLKITF